MGSVTASHLTAHWGFPQCTVVAPIQHTKTTEGRPVLHRGGASGGTGATPVCMTVNCVHTQSGQLSSACRGLRDGVSPPEGQYRGVAPPWVPLGPPVGVCRLVSRYIQVHSGTITLPRPRWLLEMCS